MSSVWYIGRDSRRAIYARDWLKAIGSGSYSDTIWEPANGWSIPTTSFTNAQLAVLGQDSDFALNQADGPRTSVAPSGPDVQQSAMAYYAAAQQIAAQNTLTLAKAESKLVSIGDNGFGTSLVANVTSTAGTSKLVFKVGVPATKISALFTHWYTSIGTNHWDTDPAGPIVFSASLEIISSSSPGVLASAIYRFKFGGKLTTTLDPGGSIKADPLGISLVQGDVVAVRTYLSSGTAYAPKKTWGTLAANNGGFTAATDLTAPGAAAVTASNGFYYGPAALLGYAEGGRTAKSVGGITDSIGVGLGDNGAVTTKPAISSGGYLLRALTGLAGFLNLGVGGDMASSFQSANGNVQRGSLLGMSNTVILEDSSNDLYVAGTPLTAAQLEVVQLDLATKCRRLGTAKVFLTTALPRTTSTDNWLTTTNQTTITGETERINYNTWLRGGCPIDPVTLAPVAVGTLNALLAGSVGHPITGYFETADRVESARNSGLWKAAKRVATGSITTGQSTLTSTDANFQSAIQESGGDLGTAVVIKGAGTSGADLTGANIAVVTSATTVTIGAVAGTTVTNVQLGIGVRTVDGVHPSSDGHNDIVPAVDITKL